MARASFSSGSIAVDDKYMFTITDSVANSGAAPATVQPYALILRHGRPNVAGYSVLHEGFVGVITGGGARGRLTLPVQEVTYATIEKDTGKAAHLQGRRRLARLHRQVLGLRGYSRPDRPDRSAVLSHRNRTAGGLPGRFPREGANGRAGSLVRDDDPRLRRGERGQHDRQLRVQSRHQEVLSDDRLGLVLDDHHPDVPAAGRDLQSRRQFRRRDPDRHGSRQARLLPARQSLLHFDGEDEEDPAADRGAEGPLSRRQASSSSRSRWRCSSARASIRSPAACRW